MGRTNTFVALALMVGVSGWLSGQRNANDYPNPYRNAGAWGALPPAPLATPITAAEGVAADAAGNVYGAVAPARGVQKHVKK